MAGIPEIIDPNEEAEQISARLDDLEKLMQEAETLRRHQFLISLGTILLMLLILTLSIFGLVTYFRSYPKRQLMHEVIRQNRKILSDPYRFGYNPRHDQELVRHFTREMRREIRQRRPVLRQELRTELRAMNHYASHELKQFFQTRLYILLTAETNRYLAERKQEPDARQQRLLRQMNVELAAAVADRLFGDSERETDQAARRSFELFRTETEHLRKSESYQALTREPLEMVERRMLEDLLECLLCRLNDVRGDGVAGPGEVRP